MAIWNLLSIAPTANEGEIGRAYARAVCLALDANDDAAFQPLREACAEALAYARERGQWEAETEKAAADERSALLSQLFQRTQELCDSGADEDAWLELTSSPGFLALQYDAHLIAWLERLCRKPGPAMASALYSAYGLASTRGAAQHPTDAGLRQTLTDYCRLPTSDAPILSQHDILRLTRSILDGMLALQQVPQSVHLWQQVFQISDFLRMRHQPHFLLALGRFINRHKLSGECLLTLAEACTEQIRRSPCASELAARLPEYHNSQAWPPPELFAGFLLQGNAKEFFDGARDKIFFLLERTAANFRHSSQRHPWDYVFTRPQFSLVKHDSAFLERLMLFLREQELPLAFWQSLHGAYLEDFLKQDCPASPLPSGMRELVREKIMQPPAGQEKRPRHCLCSLPFLWGMSILYLIAVLWLCFQQPAIGIPLLLAPLLLLFWC